MDLKRFRIGLLGLLLTYIPLSAQVSVPGGPAGLAPVGETAYQSLAIRDSLVQWEEHISLHTDRDRALPGELLFFKAYATTGPSRLRVSPGGVLKVELRDAQMELVSSQYYPLEDGLAQGVVRLPEKLDSGVYILRAFTRWMRNYGPRQYFEKQIHVGDLDPESGAYEEPPLPQVVEAVPEGGTLLAGWPNKLAIRATDSLGRPAAFEGHLVSEDGAERFPVSALNTGVGMVVFTPTAGRTYQLKLSNGVVQPIPEVAERGYSLGVNTLDPDHLRIRIRATADHLKDQVRLRGQLDGQTFFEQELTFGSEPELDLEIPKAGIPSGILDLQLVDQMGKIRSRRPVTLGGEPLRIEISPVAHRAYKIKVTDAVGNPVRTQLSVSATRNTEVDAIDRASDFNNRSSRQERFLADLQVMGMSSEWEETDVPTTIRYPVQKGLELIGYAYDLNNNLLRNTEIQVVGSADNTLILDEVTTDAYGILRLLNLKVEGEMQLVFRTTGEGTRERLVRIEPLEPEEDTQEEKTGKEVKKRKSSVVESTPWTDIDTVGLIALSEAVVEGEKSKEPKGSPSLYGITPDFTVYQDPKRPVQTEILLTRIPGVTVSGDLNMNPRITLPMRLVATGAPVLWVVDGFVMGVQGMDGHPFSLIPSTDIERIEFVVGPQAAIFGARGAGGAFLLYTRSAGGLDYIRRKDAQLLFKGFEPQVDFETYNVDRKRRKTDLSTLYWNPEVVTDIKGEAEIRLEGPVPAEAVRVEARTVLPNGQSGFAVEVFPAPME